MMGFLFFVIRMGLVTAWIYEIMLSMMDNWFLLFWFPQTILHRVHVIYGPELYMVHVIYGHNPPKDRF